MRQPVTAKQPNSRMCFVCGLRNPAGLHAAFYQVQSGELVALFRPAEHHEGYPGRLHGGVAAAILDETIGRAIMGRTSGEAWGVTVQFSMKLRKPVPLDQELRVVARIEKDGNRFFEGSGEILLPDGTVAVEATGRYLRVPIERIMDSDRDAEQWRVAASADDPRELEVSGAAPRAG